MNEEEMCFWSELSGDSPPVLHGSSDPYLFGIGTRLASSRAGTRVSACAVCACAFKSSALRSSAWRCDDAMGSFYRGDLISYGSGRTRLLPLLSASVAASLGLLPPEIPTGSRGGGGRAGGAPSGPGGRLSDGEFADISGESDQRRPKFRLPGLKLEPPRRSHAAKRSRKTGARGIFGSFATNTDRMPETRRQRVRPPLLKMSPGLTRTRRLAHALGARGSMFFCHI